MNLKNIKDIHKRKKERTLRPYKGTLKGSFKVKSQQKIKKGMYDKEYCFIVEITAKKIVDINKLSVLDFNKLGYKDKAEYLKEPFNKGNKSNLRIQYSFKVIETNYKRLTELNIL